MRSIVESNAADAIDGMFLFEWHKLSHPSHVVGRWEWSYPASIARSPDTKESENGQQVHGETMVNPPIQTWHGQNEKSNGSFIEITEIYCHYYTMSFFLPITGVVEIVAIVTLFVAWIPARLKKRLSAELGPSQVMGDAEDSAYFCLVHCLAMFGP